MKLTIGLTRTDLDEKQEIYINWLQQAGSVTVITLEPGESRLDLLDHCDALVLSGGRDIDPAFYGGSPVYHNAPVDFDLARDQFEANCFRKAVELKLPVLGVCRGTQLVNCIQGGTLTQDLADKNATHQDQDNIDKVHLINITPGTLLAKRLMTTECLVNSAHHQSINRLGTDLRVNSLSPDGTIEGIEWADDSKSFFLGVQWHPERMFKVSLEESPASQKVYKAFIDAVRERHHSNSS